MIIPTIAGRSPEPDMNIDSPCDVCEAMSFDVFGVIFRDIQEGLLNIDDGELSCTTRHPYICCEILKPYAPISSIFISGRDIGFHCSLSNAHTATNTYLKSTCTSVVHWHVFFVAAFAPSNLHECLTVISCDRIIIVGGACKRDLEY